MKLARRALLAGTSALALVAPLRGRAAAPVAAVPPGIFTRSYNNRRTCHWPNETILTPALVKQRGMVLTRTYPLYGDARGTEGQPLVIPAAINGTAHHILLAATMADWVQGFDALTGDELWKVSVGQAINNTRAMDMWLINQHFGVLSTMVASPTTGMTYGCAMSSPTSSFADAQFFLFEIDPATGQPVRAALNISAATYQPPGGLPLQKFTAAVRKQRCGLALSDDGKTVYVCTGSFLESASTNRGWVIACDVSAAAMSIAASFTTTVTGSGAGIWMGSEAPVIEPVHGDVMVVTGNGDFDGVHEWGESLLRLRYTPGTAASIVEDDHSTPFTDTARVGGEAAATLCCLSSIPNALAVRDAADALPVNAMGMRNQVVAHNSAPAPTNMLSSADEDLGAAGSVYIWAQESKLEYNLDLYAGKDGIGLVVDADGMNGAALADFAPDRIQQHVYANFVTPPFWLSYYDPASPTPTDQSTIPTVYAGRTHHVHAHPAFFMCPTNGPVIFVMGENGNLRLFGLSNDGPQIKQTYLGCSVAFASPDAAVVAGQDYGGMPGGNLWITSNNGADALVHVLYPFGDANETVTRGIYAIFDASNLGKFADGSGEIVLLWTSLQTDVVFMHDKFCEGSTWNGSTYAPSYDGCIRQWGLTPEA